MGSFTIWIRRSDKAYSIFPYCTGAHDITDNYWLPRLLNIRFQCKYIAPPRDQYFTDIFNSSRNNAFVVIINKSNIKLVIKYGTFSLVFLALFLLKYQLIKIRWYFKRNKDRNTRENMPYLITRLIFAIYVLLPYTNLGYLKSTYVQHICEMTWSRWICCIQCIFDTCFNVLDMHN